MNKKIEISNIDLMSRLKPEDRKILSIMIFENFKTFIKKNQDVKSILFVYNSPIEPSIDYIISYCLDNNITCLVASKDKKDNECIVKIDSLDFDKEIYYYTEQPYIENYEKNTYTYDMIFMPVLSFDRNKQFIDYEHKINYIRYIKDKSDAIKCGYAYAIQEYYDLSECVNKLELDHIITDLNIY